MAKISSAKPSASSSKKPKKSAVEKLAVAEVKAPAPPKSLKRKKDAAEEPSKLVEEHVAEPSAKKSKTEKVVPTRNPLPPPPIPKSTKTDKKPKKFTEKKTSLSRTKQQSPEPTHLLPSGSDESEDETPASGGVKKSNPVEKEEAPPAEEGENEDEDTYLHGFSTDEDSSDDDHDLEAEPSAFDVASLPTIAKDDATVKRKLEKAKRQPTRDRGVLYLGRVPHGFYEDQMKAYFGQFGEVTRVRLSRNKRTGKSKHYGFVEFDSASVAKIVAETMDNYLLRGHILQCKVIPKDKVHPQLWVGANRKWRAVPSEQLTRAKHNKKRTEDERDAASKRLLRRQNQRKRKLEELGINYNLDNVGYKRVAKVVEPTK